MWLPLRFSRKAQAIHFCNKIRVDKSEGRCESLWGKVRPFVRGTVVYLMREDA